MIQPEKAISVELKNSLAYIRGPSGILKFFFILYTIFRTLRNISLLGVNSEKLQFFFTEIFHRFQQVGKLLYKAKQKFAI